MFGQKTCLHCGERILPGEEYAEINSSFYHWDCIESMTRKELLEMLGVHPCADASFGVAYAGD